MYRRAIFLYKKMGFIEEGVLKNNIKVGKGQYIDDIIMGLSFLRDIAKGGT